MKITVLIAAMSFPMLVWAQNDNFTIKGKVASPSKQSKVYVTYRDGGQKVTDSVELKRGEFSFKGNVVSPTPVTITLAHNDGGINQAGITDNLIVYVDKGLTTLETKDSIKNSIVSNSKINTEYLVYNAFLEQKQEGSLSNKRATLQGSLTEQKQALQKEYIGKNPDSYFSLLALQEIVGYTIDVNKVEPVYNCLSETIKNSTAGKAFAKRIEAAKSTQIGSIAPDFSQADVNGKQVKLSDFRGKYVLLDFWASWCVPCRGENPHLVAAYHKFKDRGFTALSVSLDMPGKREDWLKAIEVDKLAWTQVSDLQGWKNEVSVMYGIRAVPQSYLIDPDGKIIAINLIGDKLDKKLTELLGN